MECETFAYSQLSRDIAKGSVHTMETLRQVHEAISIERRAQLEWLETTLAAYPDSVKIVIGHHAIESASLVHGPQVMLRKDLLPILNRQNALLYIAGHDHNLQYILRPYSRLHHVVCGGGGFVTTSLSLHPVFEKKEYPGLVFGSPTFGIVTGTLRPDSLHLDFVDYWGEVIFNTTIAITKPPPPKRRPLP